MLSNLPAQLTSFIGRERETAEITRLLAATRLLTLTGSGGAGKTRLALQVAAGLSADYADGVWLVELAALTDPVLAPSAVATALGVREEPGRPVLATLIDHLRVRSLLLVLDNCEHLIATCASLTEALLRACPHLQILVTSRQALGLTGETTWRVPPLSVPGATVQASPSAGKSTEPGARDADLESYEAIRLFVDRATAANPGFSLTDQNADAAVEICRRLDGIPLAIELAAARLKALTAEQIAERLDDRFRLLTTGSRTALPRHQTLRGTLDWSYELLAAPEQLLLRRLAVFAGGWTLEAAEQVCGERGQGNVVDPIPCSSSLVPSEDVVDLMAGLVEKSLALSEEEAGAARFRLLETVRQYAWERLEASGQVACARSAHAEYFLTLAEEAHQRSQGPERKGAFDRLEAEHDNLRAALGWWFDRDVSLSLRLAAAVWPFWEARGHAAEGYERLSALLSAADGQAPTPARAEVWRGHAHLAGTRGDFGTARASCEESLAISQALGDQRSMAQAMLSFGLIAGLQGELREARARLEQSLAMMRELSDPSGVARVLNNYGILLEQLGDYDAARAQHEECLTIVRELGDRRRIGLSLNNLGEVTAFHGDYATARRLHEEALTIDRALGDPGNVASTLAALSRVTFEMGDHDVSHRLLDESLTILWRTGARRVVPRCLEGLAAIAAARRAPVAAAHLFGAAEALREAFGTPVFNPYRPWLDKDVAAARVQLDPETFATAWGEGRAMSLDEAVAYALSLPAPSAPAEEPQPAGAGIPLSAREREVAVLLAQGLTNRRIADELVVATSTIDRHVVNILRKLDLSSRAQIAVWAVEHGLASAAP